MEQVDALQGLPSCCLRRRGNAGFRRQGNADDPMPTRLRRDNWTISSLPWCVSMIFRLPINLVEVMGFMATGN
jgi:hypothetical protein